MLKRDLVSSGIFMLLICYFLTGCESVTVMDQVNKPIHDIKLTNDDFVHQPSGVKFPVIAGGWQRRPVAPANRIRPEIAIYYQISELKGHGKKEVEYVNTAKVSAVLLNGRSPSAIAKTEIKRWMRKHPEGDTKLEVTPDYANVLLDPEGTWNYGHQICQIYVAKRGNYAILFETEKMISVRNQGYNFLGSLVKAF